MTARTRHLGYVLKRFPRISETFVAAELIELERQGERVTVFALSRPQEPFEHAFVGELGARVVYLPHRPLREPVRVLRALAHVVRASPRAWLRAAASCFLPPSLAGLRKLFQATVLRDELERARIDHVHAHFATSAARLANLARRMGGPSYSVTAHAKDIYADVRTAHLREKLLDAAFVATVSEANATYLSSLLDARRPSVVHNAVDLRRLGAAGDDRARARRRPHRRAADREEGPRRPRRRLRRPRAPGRAASAWRSSATGRCEPSSRSLPRADTSTRSSTGPLPNEQVLELYRRATVFCLPCVVAESGDRDGLPTSVLEAMALGLPVVTTSVNGLAEAVIHERTGLVVPERDPDGARRCTRAARSRIRSCAGGSRATARRHVEAHFSLAENVVLLRSLFPEAA